MNSESLPAGGNGTAGPASGPWSSPHWSIWLLLLVASVVRLAQFGAPPHVDELYHVLPALSWLERGTLEIGGGEYTRAPAFTVMVAGSLQIFGDSLRAARVPALLFGLAWIALVFLWTQQVAGLKAAWAAGLLFTLDPGAINLAQFTRFYTLQGLLVWIGATGVFWAMARDAGWKRRGTAGGIAGLALLAAFYFQPATAIGLTALSLWVTVELTAGSVPGWRFGPKKTMLVLAVSAVVVGTAAYQAGLVEDAWSRYRTAADWAERWADQWRFYHWWFEERYPVLWRLFPLAAVGAVARHRRAAVFALVMFSIPMVLHSFAAQKHERYLYYAIPFFFVTWGIVIADLVPEVLEAGRRAGRQLSAKFVGAASRGRRIGLLLVGAAVGFAAYTSPAWTMTARMVQESGYERPYGHPDWGAAEGKLRDLAAGKELVLASRAVKAMYYVGRADADILASPSQTSNIGRTDGYQLDLRLGRPIISSPEQLSRFLSCFDSGLVVVEEGLWGAPAAVSPALVRLLTDHTREVRVPEEWGLIVRQWSGSVGDLPSELGKHCSEIPGSSVAAYRPGGGRSDSPSRQGSGKRQGSASSEVPRAWDPDRRTGAYGGTGDLQEGGSARTTRRGVRAGG